MTTSGRNEIKINNSDGKCLMENWVEERAVHHIEPYDTNQEDNVMSKIFKDGHRGLLSLHTNVRFCTTQLDHYRSPEDCNVRTVGKREQVLRQMLKDKYKNEIAVEQKPEISEYISETQSAHNIPGFISKKQLATQNHEYKSEQPVTIWTELQDKMHGTTQKTNKVSAFHKSTGFTEQKDENANSLEINYPKNAAYI